MHSRPSSRQLAALACLLKQKCADSLSVLRFRAKHADPRFPVGKARLEAVGVILCACLMTLSSFEVVRSSATDIYDGLVKGEGAEPGDRSMRPLLCAQQRQVRRCRS